MAWSSGVAKSHRQSGCRSGDPRLEAFRRDLSGKVRENAFGLASAEEKSRVARAVADRFRALREVLVQRDPAGIAPQLEVRILEATELTLRRRASEFALTVDAERVRLNLLRERPLRPRFRSAGPSRLAGATGPRSPHGCGEYQ